MDNYQIFISYRRDGGEYLAGRLNDKLSEMGYHVFYDVESMRSGKFNEQIYDAIDACTDILLVLPPNALDRCKAEDDWVRLEIERAIQKKKNIIPVMMRNFSFPSVLPKSIDCIRSYEGVTASSEYFDAVVAKITKLLHSKNSHKFGLEDKQNAEEEASSILKIMAWLIKHVYSWRIIFYAPAALLAYVLTAFGLGILYDAGETYLPKIGYLPGIVILIMLIAVPTLCGIAMMIIAKNKKMNALSRTLATVSSISLITVVGSLLCNQSMYQYDMPVILTLLFIPFACSTLAAIVTVLFRLFVSFFMSDMVSVYIKK